MMVLKKNPACRGPILRDLLETFSVSNLWLSWMSGCEHTVRGGGGLWCRMGEPVRQCICWFPHNFNLVTHTHKATHLPDGSTSNLVTGQLGFSREFPEKGFRKEMYCCFWMLDGTKKQNV